MKDTREHIIQTSLLLFLSKGYKEVSLAKILEATALSKGAFYHYFESKEALYAETIDRFLFAQADSIYKPSSSALSFWERIQEILLNKKKGFEQFAQITGESMSLASFIQFVLQAIQYIPEVKSKVSAHMEKEIGVYTLLTEDAIKTGELKADLDPGMIAEHIFNLLDGVELHAVVADNPQTIYQKELHLITGYYQLIKA